MHCEFNDILDKLNNIFKNACNVTFENHDVVNNLPPTSNVSKNRGLEKNVNLLGKKYHIARKIFQHTKTDEKKRKMLTESKNYKKVTNRFYSVYRRNLQTKIRKMSKNDPKQYWKLINGGKKVDGSGVD